MNLRFHEAANRLATHATLRAVRILSGALDSELRTRRETGDALGRAVARIKELEARNGILQQLVETFRARLRKIRPKRRPHYPGPARFKALEVRQALGWSIEEAADQFLVSEPTFARWEDAADPARNTVGPDIEPDPPIRRYADVVRSLIHLADRLGMGRAHQICAHIARGGWRISKTYVESVLKSEPSHPLAQDPGPVTGGMPLRGEFIGHVFILDSHEIKSFLGHRKFFLTGVLDAHTQAPLGLRASETPPTAVASANLLKRVIEVWGKPRYVAIDGGSEFKGPLRRASKRAGARLRLGSPGKTTIAGLIERFWRTIDDLMGVKLNAPLTLVDLETRLAQATMFYAYCRPIFALDAATPAERLGAIEPRATRAIQPPRGRPGIERGPPPMRIAWLNPDTREFPYFEPA